MATDLMQPGGGLTKSKLLLANASESDVSQGKKFYAGDKQIKTGTLVERGQYQYAGGVGCYGDYVAFNRIPEGIYRAGNNPDWAPEIRMSEDQVINFIVDNFRSKVLKRLNLNLELSVSAALGTHGSTPYSAAYGAVKLNGGQIMYTGGESQNMNGAPLYWNKTYRIV